MWKKGHFEKQSFCNELTMGQFLVPKWKKSSPLPAPCAMITDPEGTMPVLSPAPHSPAPLATGPFQQSAPSLHVTLKQLVWQHLRKHLATASACPRGYRGDLALLPPLILAKQAILPEPTANVQQIFCKLNSVLLAKGIHSNGKRMRQMVAENFMYAVCSGNQCCIWIFLLPIPLFCTASLVQLARNLISCCFTAHYCSLKRQ